MYSSSILSCQFILSSFVFFFKQKTAYEMRISDWSSDVCSSDLLTNYRQSCSPYFCMILLTVVESSIFRGPQKLTLSAPLLCSISRASVGEAISSPRVSTIVLILLTWSALLVASVFGPE